VRAHRNGARSRRRRRRDLDRVGQPALKRFEVTTYEERIAA
jgi:hypothetical protein